MRIGIDLGGTKTEAIALDAAGTAIFRERRPTPAGDYDATLATVRDLVAEAERAGAGGATVGIGIPGSLSPETGLVRNANSTWLIGRPLDRDLEACLDRPVRMANDADCFALSEATDGAGAGHGTVFGVILGTGVGGGIVVNGRLLSGPNAIAGEWGHNPLPWPEAGERPGPPCYCGQTGCIETFLSGPGLAADHRRHTGAANDPAAIAAAAAAGDRDADASLGRYAGRLARALAAVINVLDPDAIVLGGGMGNIQRLYGDLPPLLARHVFSDSVRTRIVPPVHGDSSGVRGAAWLWPEDGD